MSDLGDSLRARLQAVFDELDVDAQVTGVASLWGVHFTPEDVTDYRSVLRADRDMKKRLFIAMLNEGGAACRSTAAARCPRSPPRPTSTR